MKTALVTGAARGIGRAAAEALSGAGVRVLGLDLSFPEYTDEARQRILRVNLEAPVELIRAASKAMVARRSGRIVNLASVAGRTASR